MPINFVEILFMVLNLCFLAGILVTVVILLKVARKYLANKKD